MISKEKPRYVTSSLGSNEMAPPGFLFFHSFFFLPRYAMRGAQNDVSHNVRS